MTDPDITASALVRNATSYLNWQVTLTKELLDMATGTTGKVTWIENEAGCWGHLYSVIVRQ